MDAVTRQDATEKYLEVEKLIYHTVHKFIARYGGDFSDRLSRANELFLKTYNEYSGRWSFAASVRWVVWTGLLDDVRREAKMANKSRRELIDLTLLSCRECPVWDWREWSDNLSTDARDVLRLIFDDEASQPIMKVAELKGGEGRNIRSTIREHLIGTGWTAKRVTETFTEIKEALK